MARRCERRRLSTALRQAVTGTLDSDAVLRRRDRFASHWKDDGQVQWLDSQPIDLARGVGRLDGERRVVVTPHDGPEFTLTARHAVAVCTGSRAAIPPIPGVESAGVWTSREATSAKAVPRRLVIIGGGVVACEMADAWRTLGSEEVTLVVLEGRLLFNTEDFAGEAVRAAFEERGISVLLNTVTERVTRAASGEVTVELADGRTITGDELLVATGRAPRSDSIGLDTVGLQPGSWLHRRRQLSRGGRTGLALCSRRREPSRAAHAHGQIPGARVRRRHRRAGKGAT